MQEIVLTGGEARLFREKMMFKEIVEELNANMNKYHEACQDANDDTFDIITDFSAMRLAALFDVPANTFFKAEWSMIEWYTDVTEAYTYAQGMISVIRMS